MENNLLSLLNKEEKKLIKTKMFGKTSTIFYEGDECTSMVIIVSGSGSIESYSQTGHTVVFKTLKKGDIFGNNLLFSSDNIFKGNVIINSNSILVFIDKKNLIYLLKNNEEFLLEFLKIQGNSSKELHSQISILASQTVKEKIIKYIEINNGEIEIKSITKFANEINVARETVSRTISNLIIKKIITKKGKKYLLN